MEAAQLVGTVVFAVSGLMAVVDRQLDWFGGIVVAVVTSIGGGTLRDLILDEAPVFWVEDQTYLVAAGLGAVAAIPAVLVLAKRPPRLFEETLELLDAAGLALFSIAGASVALEAGFDGLTAVVAGLLSGVGGGVIRDLLADRTPLVLSEEIYATAALAGLTAFVVTQQLPVLGTVSAVLGAVIILGLRLLGIRRRWSLPSLAK